MVWPDIRTAYPDQWLIIEALEAHTAPDMKRHLNKLAVMEVGGMDYGFEINGILGMDFLTQSGAIINLSNRTITFAT